MDTYYIPVYSNEKIVTENEIRYIGTLNQVGAIRVDEWRTENQYDALNKNMETIKSYLPTLKDAEKIVLDN